MIRSGEICWASCPEAVAFDPGYRLLVWVVQTNEFDDGGLRTVIVLTITSNLRLAAATARRCFRLVTASAAAKPG